MTLTPSSWAPRRGDGITVAVEIGEPEAKRDIKVGLLCQVGYDVATRDPGETGTTRETRWENLVAEWLEIDSAAEAQTLQFQIPEDMCDRPGRWRPPRRRRQLRPVCGRWPRSN